MTWGDYFDFKLKELRDSVPTELMQRVRDNTAVLLSYLKAEESKKKDLDTTKEQR